MDYVLTKLIGFFGIVYSLVSYVMAILGLNNIPNWNPDIQIFVLLLSCIVVNTSCIAEKINAKGRTA